MTEPEHTASEPYPKPIALSLSPENIPQVLQSLRHWVVWRYVHKDGKWTKPPFRADGNGHASSTAPATWSDYGTALATYQKGGVDGIGFVLTREQQIVGIDLDHCIDGSNGISPWAQAIIKGFNAYTEVSPSGTGIHIYFRAEKRGGGRKRGNIEVYPEGRYLTFTGRVLKAHPVRAIEPRQAELDAFVAEHFPEPKIEKSAAANGNGHLSDHEILEIGLCAKNGDKLRSLLAGNCGGYPSPSEAEMAFCRLLAFYTKDESQIDRFYRGSKLFREKWDTKHYGDGATYGEHTIRKAIASTVESYKRPAGENELPHVYREQVTHRGNEIRDLSVTVPDDIPESLIEPAQTVDFPEAAWAGLFGQWRDMVGNKTEAPFPYLWAAFLQAVGLMVARSVWRESPRPLYPNFFVLLLGQTGDSRKSTVEWFEHQLLTHLGVDVEILFGIVSTEGIIERLAQREGVKALGYSDEFRSLLSVAKRKGTQDILPRLQSLYSCPEKESVDRRQAPATAINPFFSLLAATPQDFIVDLIGELEVRGGFLNRFLIITGEEQPPKPIVSQPTPAEWGRLVEPLHGIQAEIHRNPQHREFETEAEELWREFYIGWRKERRKWNSKAADLTSRTFEHVLKISLVYSVLASERKISALSLATAISIGAWLESNVLRLFGDAGLDQFGRAERMVLEILRKSKNGRMFRRDLQQLAAKKGINGETFGRVLKAMEANEHVRMGYYTTGAGHSRPTVEHIREQEQISPSRISVKVLPVTEQEAKIEA
jgi:hypothetical protein